MWDKIKEILSLIFGSRLVVEGTGRILCQSAYVAGRAGGPCERPTGGADRAAGCALRHAGSRGQGVRRDEHGF